MPFFSTVLGDDCLESVILCSPGGIGGGRDTGEASETRRVPRGRASYLENYWCCYGGCRNGLAGRWGRTGRATWSSSHPARDRRVCPGAGQRVDRAGRRHRPSVEREQLGRRHLSSLVDQNDDLVPDLRGAEHGSATARSVSAGQRRGGEQVADEARSAAGRFGRRSGPDTRHCHSLGQRCRRGVGGRSRRKRACFRREHEQQGPEARDEEHLLSKCLRPARSGAAHNGARYCPAGARSLSRLSSRIPIFFNS